MNLSLITSLMAALTLVMAFSPAEVEAQTVYQMYRLETKIVYDKQPVTTYRLKHEIVNEERQVMKPVWQMESRVRRVAKPVFETETRVHRVTVRKPVTTTETRVRQQIVQQPVTTQVMKTQQRVVTQPVTTMHTQYVDQGQYVQQYVLQPGATRNRLQWLQGGYVQNPATGTMIYQRGGLHWVPTQSPNRYQLQQQYVPNVVAQQVPVTSYQQSVVNEQVPVNVTQYQQNVVNQEYQVQVCKWVDEVQDQPYQVTTQKIQYEDEPYEVRVCKWVPDKQTVSYTVAKWVPETTTRMVPRTVTQRVPIQTCSPCTTAYYPYSAYYYGPAQGQPTVAKKQEAKKPDGEGEAGNEPKDSDPTGDPELDATSKAKAGVVERPVGGEGDEAASEGEAAGGEDEAAGDDDIT